MATRPIIPPAVPQPNKLRPIAVPNRVLPLPAGAATLLDREAIPLGIFQVFWVQNILPFLTSLTLHATFIIIGFLTIQAIRIMKSPATEEQTLIPDIVLVEQGPPGGVPHVGVGDPIRKAMALDSSSATPEGFADKKGPKVDLRAAAAEGADSNDAVIGLGPGGGFSKSGGKPGAASGDPSGTMAKLFGAPDGGGIGPKGPVFGHGGNAHTIVFVCDCTGSMINKLQVLKVELAKAVMALHPIQSFTVIFYQDQGYRIWQKQLTAATPENKRRFNDWLNDISSSGPTDPLPAIELGLKIHPHLMYFLTDAADFPDVNAVVQLFGKANADKKVKVNTILFVESAAEEEQKKQSEPLMRGIAKNNGGVFKWVRLDELQ